jgi:hypothetical protein
MSSCLYTSFKRDRNDGLINLASDTIKVALVTSSYSPNQDTHEKFSDVANEVAAGNGYTAGGAALSNKTVTKDNTNHAAVFDADDVSWDPSTITARAAVIYKDTGTPSTSPLIAYIDFGADKSSSSDRFRIIWNANGIIRDA